MTHTVQPPLHRCARASLHRHRAGQSPGAIRREWTAALLAGALVAMSPGSADEHVPGAEPRVSRPEPEAIESLRPEVSIEQFHNRAVEEYRVGNNVYMIKVTPSHGVPYYLVDPDGSGTMQWRRRPIGGGVSVPQWTLIQW